MSQPAHHIARPRFLMCSPEHFDTHFLFNPFMRFTDRVDRRRARRQWSRLVKALEDAGASIEFLDPAPDSSALPFTADGALCYSADRVLLLRNDGPRGELEPPLFREWFVRQGFEVEALPPAYRLDGGNLLDLGTGDYLAGLKPGASGQAEAYLDRLLKLVGRGRVSTVPLVGPLYLHLDLVVGVLGPGRCLAYLGGLAGGRVPASGPLSDATIVSVDEDDAKRFACNLVVVGETVITGPVSDDLVRRVERLGYRVQRVDLSEFYKAGGGAKCLTLPLVPARASGPAPSTYGTPGGLGHSLDY